MAAYTYVEDKTREELRKYTYLLLSRLGYEPCCFGDGDECGDNEFIVGNEDFAKT